MITLLHGDYIEASRKELVHLRSKYPGKEIRELEGRGLDLPALTQALESQSLFGDDTVVVITNLLKALGRKSKQSEAYTALLADRGASTEIILWEDKEVSKTMVGQLGKVTVRLFSIPTVIFQFLDSVGPGNTKKSLMLFVQLMETEPAEIVWAMLTKRMRQLVTLVGGETPVELQGWQVGRLTTQAKLFSMEKITMVYRSMTEIEYSVKSGSTPFTLAQHITQLLIAL